MFKQLLSIVKRIQKRNQINRDPIAYARSIGVRVGKNCQFWGVNDQTFNTEPWLITIGDNVFISGDVQFITHDGGSLPFRKEVPDLEWTAPITVGSDVFIGMRATILPGAKIGDRCVIGAGAVVSKTVPPNSVFAGNPARFVKSADDYFEGLKRRSLKCGDLVGDAKAKIIKRHYGITHV